MIYSFFREFAAFFDLTLAFQLFTRKLFLQISGLRMHNFCVKIDFLLKMCWSIPCLPPSWRVQTRKDV